MFLVIGLLLCVFFSALVYRRLDVSDERFALDGLSAHEANVWVSFTRFHQLRHASQVLTPVTKLDLIEIRLNFGRRISRMREHLLFFFRRGENRDYFELFLEFLVHFSRLYEIGLILLIQSFSISVRVRFLEFHICFITLDRVVQKLLLIHASEIEGLLFDRYPPLGLRIQQSRGLFCRLLDRPGKVAGGRRVGDRLDEGGISRVVFWSFERVLSGLWGSTKGRRFHQRRFHRYWELGFEFCKSVRTAHFGAFQVSPLVRKNLGFVLCCGRFESLDDFEIGERLRKLILVWRRQISPGSWSNQSFKLEILLVNGLHSLLGVRFRILADDHLVVGELVVSYGFWLWRYVTLGRARYHRVILVHPGVDRVLGWLHNVGRCSPLRVLGHLYSFLRIDPTLRDLTVASNSLHPSFNPDFRWSIPARTLNIIRNPFLTQTNAYLFGFISEHISARVEVNLSAAPTRLFLLNQLRGKPLDLKRPIVAADALVDRFVIFLASDSLVWELIELIVTELQGLGQRLNEMAIVHKEILIKSLSLSFHCVFPIFNVYLLFILLISSFFTVRLFPNVD